MNKIHYIVCVALGLALWSACRHGGTDKKEETEMIQWNRLPDLPGMEGTASLGVSAPFTGVTGNRLIVAGGCNFPDKPVAEGGTKQYYAEIWTLDLSADSAQWTNAGVLPRAVAYGASIGTPYGIVCAGGNDSASSFTDVFLLSANDTSEACTIRPLPSLPVAMDNFAATYMDGKVYVAGGNANGTPSHAFYYLDLSVRTDSGRWEKLPDFPGAARVQPVLVAQHCGNEEYRLYLAGGFQPGTTETPPQIPDEILAFSPRTGTWETETALPPLSDGNPRTLTGGCAVACGDSAMLFFGGVNYTRFFDAVDRPRQMALARAANDTRRLEALQSEAAGYLRHPVDWYRFNDEVLHYDVRSRTWTNRGAYEAVARAGAGALFHNRRLIVVNGEIKPGIRTPRVSVGMF